MNIRLNKKVDEAVYARSVPSRPFALSEEFISQVHSKFGVEVLKMNSRAIFFDCTTVYVGVCNANLAKSLGYRKIN